MIICLLVVSVSMAQSRFDSSKEIGLAVGTSYYIGDLNPDKHFGGRLNIAGGLTYRNNINRRWTVKASVLYGKLEAYDEDSDDPWQVNRNLHFINEIYEGSLQIELNYFNYQIGSKGDFWTPYLFAGIGYRSMNPQAEYEGNLYDLQALGTEGQGTTEGDDPYALTGVVLPFGVGFKLNVWKRIAINLEWGMRKTYTDYMDDVSTTYVNPAVLAEENGVLSALLADRSIQQDGLNGDNDGIQRGDPGRNDWYNFTTFTLAFRIDKTPTTCWK